MSEVASIMKRQGVDICSHISCIETMRMDTDTLHHRQRLWHVAFFFFSPITVVSACLQCIDNFYLMLFSQSLDAVMEEGVDVVLNPLDFLSVDALQLGLQVLQIDLEHKGRDRQAEGRRYEKQWTGNGSAELDETKYNHREKIMMIYFTMQ